MLESIIYLVMGMTMALCLVELPKIWKDMYNQLKHDMSTPGEWVE